LYHLANNWQARGRNPWGCWLGFFNVGKSGAINQLIAEWYNTIYAKAHSKGGHFGPWENPEAFIEGIRETFRLANPSKHQK